MSKNAPFPFLLFICLFQPLKRALARMGAPTNLIPEQIENCLSYAVVSYLKKLKNQVHCQGF